MKSAPYKFICTGLNEAATTQATKTELIEQRGDKAEKHDPP
jgi:hypothetical protein